MRDRYSQVPQSRTNEGGGAHYHQQYPSQHQCFPEDIANLTDRLIRSVPPPAVNKPGDADFFLQNGHGGRKPNHALLKEHFFREGRLREEDALYILNQTTRILSKESNMVHVRSPVTVCGDIHGQYYDLMKLFEVGGPMADNAYLFLGNYVNWGDFGIECLLYLYALKIWNPSGIILLRGNHECRRLTECFTFKRECLHKYSDRVYEACVLSFCALPITALIGNRFFCVHGGLSPQLVHLSDVDAVNRFQEPGSYGLLCDLLWSDPVSNYGHEHEPSADGAGLSPGQAFLHNQTRGCSFSFTYEAVCAFLERNNLLTVIRGHEAQDLGFTIHPKTPKKNFPSLITIFSAPGYDDVYHNRGAVLKYANKNITIRQYNSSTHPYCLPNFEDAFTWSLPYVGSRIKEMLLAILRICDDDELAESKLDEDAAARGVGEPLQSQTDLAQRRQSIKAKIMAVGKMLRILQMLREEAENARELYSLTKGGFSHKGPSALTVQGHKIGNSIRTLDLEHLIKRLLDDDQSEATAMSTSKVERLTDRIAQGRNARELVPHTKGGFSQRGLDVLTVQGHKIKKSIRTFDDAYRSDIANERLSDFDPQWLTIFPILRSTRPRGRTNLPDVMDTLTVQSHEIRKSIRTFDEARRSDIANERLSDLNPQRTTIFPVPSSMRLSSRTDLSDDMDVEYLINRTLDDDQSEATAMSTSTVERLANRISQGRKPTGRPRALKRHETVI